MRANTTRLAAAAAASVAVMITGTACSAGTPEAGPTTTATLTVTAPVTSSAPVTVTTQVSPPATTSAPTGDCAINPSTAPLQTVEPYGTVPEVGRISVTLTGVPSGTVTPGSAPTEVDVTLCNGSPVDYPAVGVVLVLGHCSCAPNPMSIPVGTVERFDDSTGSWIPSAHPAAGTGMDFLGEYSNVQELVRGAAATVRYRIALDASMHAGDGAVEAVAVIPEPLNQLGSADLAYSVTP